MGLLFNGEVPGFYALLGGALVITAVVAWTIWSSKSPPRKSMGKNQTLAYNETEPALRPRSQ